MIVDSALYRDGTRVAVDCALDDWQTLLKMADRPGDFVWVGLHDPDAAVLDRAAAAFGLHPLAVEDALTAHQRPKLDQYGDSLFLTLKTLHYVDHHDTVETGQVDMFVGERFVVTVRHGPGTGLHDARLALEADRRVLAHGPSAVIYAVCDHVVDEYVVIAAHLEDDVAEVEASVFSANRTHASAHIYALKRELVEVRRAVMPLREPMHLLAQGHVKFVDTESAPFFSDVDDHVRRTADIVDGLDILLSTAFEAHLARVSVQQNEDMRKISAGAALVVVPTLIAGIYGMNFEHMPELHWALGYPMALLMMVGTSLGLLYLFKRSGWL